MNDASSDSRNATGPAISAGSDIRPSGVCFSHQAIASSSLLAVAIERIDSRGEVCTDYRVGSTVVFLGGGRRGAEDAIDPSVGIADIAEIGQQVDSGVPLAVIHAASESSWEHAAKRLKSSFQIGPRHVDSLPVIYARVEGEQTHESS